MKIYIVSNSDDTLGMNIVDLEQLNSSLNYFGKVGVGESVDQEIFKHLKFYLDIENQPNNVIQNFSDIGSDFTFDMSVHNSDLLDFFEKSGEVFEVNMLYQEKFQGVKYWFYNITNIINCLNEDKSKSEYYSSGNLRRIHDFVFDENKIPYGTSFFRIPQLKKTITMLVVGNNMPEKDFYFLYHSLGMNGLKFNEIYRTPGERDYDIEDTINKIKEGEKLELPVFKKGILGKLFQ